MTFHSNQINQGLPLNARQIQDFQIYDSPTYSSVGLGGQVTGPIRDQTGVFSLDMRRASKNFLSQTARVWVRAVSAWLRLNPDVRPWHHSWTASHSKRGGVSRGLPRVTGSKYDLIRDLKRFVDDCPFRANILPALGSFHLISRGLVETSTQEYARHQHEILRHQMQIDDLQHWRETRGRELDGLPPLAIQEPAEEPAQEPAQEPDNVVPPEHNSNIRRYLELINENNALHLLPPETLEFLQVYFSNTDTDIGALLERIAPPPQTPPEPNPLDLLPPEPTLQESLCDDVKGELTCPITYEIMRDPVIDPEGNSYEKLAILAHLKKSQSSPVTRSPLTEEQLISNRALKQIIDAFTV